MSDVNYVRLCNGCARTIGLRGRAVPPPEPAAADADDYGCDACGEQHVAARPVPVGEIVAALVAHHVAEARK